MSAFVVAAIDEEPGRTGRPHFAEGDFLLAHAPLERDRGNIGKPLGMVVRGTLETKDRPKAASVFVESPAINSQYGSSPKK